MSNIIIALLVLLHVYCIEFIVCFFSLKVFKKLTKEDYINPLDSYISLIRSCHVVLLTGIIYFIPLVALVVCLAIKSFLVGPMILLILCSSFWVTNKIIIPLSEFKYKQLYKKYHGKDLNDQTLDENNKKG